MGNEAPVLVVSGFLGSGKTTLVRGLLADAQRTGSRVAVVSNEFGELGIDRALLGPGDQAYVELEGGCVCCELSSELVETLQMLWEKVHPDRVIIETSGVALPFDTQLQLWREPVTRWVASDTALVVVNALQLDEAKDLSDTFEQQVSSADMLLLNKIDLVDAAKLAGFEGILAELAPGTPIIRSTQGAVDPALLFPPNPGERRPAAARTHDHHHEAFESTEIAIERGLDPEAVCERVRSLGALRAKGFVETSSGVRIVQGVGSRVELSEIHSAPPAELLGRVVVVRRSGGAPRDPAHARKQSHRR